jgi:hypothetical protein
MVEDTEVGTAGADIPADTRAEDTEDILVTAADISGEAMLVARTLEARVIAAVILLALALTLAEAMSGLFIAASATGLWAIRGAVML